MPSPRPFAVLVLLIAAVSAVALGLGPAGASAHPEPNDVDGDYILNEQDNCPEAPNGNQINTDGDRDGDACDADDDNDGVADGADNCRVVANPGQENADGDKFGDACPPVDADADGVIDPDDNAPPSSRFCDNNSSHNPRQEDNEPDGIGDVCDRDDDNDGFYDNVDNCPKVWNPGPESAPLEQSDLDGDGIGSACDPEESIGPGPSATPPPRPGTTPTPTPTPVANDRVAPRITIKTSSRYSLADEPASFVAPVACNEQCELDVRIEVDAAGARKLRLGSRRTLLARGEWALGAKATAYVFCSWTPKARRALRRLTKAGVRGRVVVTAADPAGNERTAARSITIRP